MKILLKNQVVNLRLQGKSYSEIQKIVKVSRSTLSTWLKDIKLSDSQILHLKKDLVRKGIEKAAFLKREKRIIASQATIRQSWRDIQEHNILKDPLFVVGIALYWAEGGKTQEKISFSNSDPHMIRCIMKWLRICCKVNEPKFRIHIHIHSLHSRKNIEYFWSKITGIPLSQFTKTYIKKTSLGQRKNILYNGTCVVRVHDTILFRKFIGWKLGLLHSLNIIHMNKKKKDDLLKKIITNRSFGILPLLK